jgi:hypothetical protein
VLCHFDQSEFKTKDLEGHENVRAVYLLVFQQGDVMIDRMSKICDAFQCKKFVLPEDGYASPSKFSGRLAQLKTNILNMTGLVLETKKQMKEYLKSI